MKNKITATKYFISLLLSLLGTYFIYLSSRIFYGFKLKQYIIDFTSQLFKNNFKFHQIQLLIDKYIEIRFLPDETLLAFCLFPLGIILFILGILLIVRKIGESKGFSADNFFNNTNFGFLIIVFSLLFSSVYLLQDFNESISRFNSFKQTEVGCNIYHYVNNGFELKEYLLNDNEELKFFSFPFYQWASAVVCKVLNLEVEQGGRLVNIIVYFLTFILFYKFLSLLKVKPLIIALSLLVFATSPLAIYYYRSVHPDPMAIYFSFFSLYHFLKYDKQKNNKYFIFALVWGIIACLIKNPIYLMIFVAVLYYRFSNNGFRGILKLDSLLYISIIGLTVIFYKLLADYINQGISLRTSWIFGDLVQRLSLKPYFMLTIWQAFEIINPIFYIIAIIYIVPKIFGNQKEESQTVFIGLFLGMMTTIFIFFNVFQAHDYYHLPFVIILAVIIVSSFYKLTINNFSKNKIIVSLSMIAFILVQISWFYLAKMPIKPDEKIIASAKFIQKNSEKDSYIFYTVNKSVQGWDPTYLFHTRRKGFNICLLNINKKGYIDSIINKYAYYYDKVYLFIPNFLENESVAITKYSQIAKNDSVGILYLLHK